jgi:hypothetical protein
MAQRYRFEGKVRVSLAVQMEPHAKLQGPESSFSPEPVQAFRWSAEEGCSRHPPLNWSIVYGLLRNPQDHAYLYTGARMHRVLTAPIPHSIHLSGVLGYAVLRGTPSRVLVRDAAGRSVEDVRLGSLPKRPCNPGSTATVAVEPTTP